MRCATSLLRLGPFAAIARLAARAAVAVLVAAALGAAVHAQPGPLAPLDSSGRMTYYIAADEASSADRELAQWALAAWERAAGGTIRFEPAAEAAALVRIYFVGASAGLYGEMRALNVDGRRGAAVYIRPDTAALGAEIAALAAADPLLRETIVYLTCVHELGHALGLRHTADFHDVMYSFQFGGDIPAFFGRYRELIRSRGDLAGVGSLSSGDLEQLRALYAPGASP